MICYRKKKKISNLKFCVLSVRFCCDLAKLHELMRLLNLRNKNCIFGVLRFLNLRFSKPPTFRYFLKASDVYLNKIYDEMVERYACKLLTQLLKIPF